MLLPPREPPPPPLLEDLGLELELLELEYDGEGLEERLLELLYELLLLAELLYELLLLAELLLYVEYDLLPLLLLSSFLIELF